jgi:hypothetical protein
MAAAGQRKAGVRPPSLAPLRQGHRVKEGSSSFLKKRTKKLLFIEPDTVPCGADRRQRRRLKSFLLLFFKKVQHRPLADPLG